MDKETFIYNIEIVYIYIYILYNLLYESNMKYVFD